MTQKCLEKKVKDNSDLQRHQRKRNLHVRQSPSDTIRTVIFLVTTLFLGTSASGGSDIRRAESGISGGLKQLHETWKWSINKPQKKRGTEAGYGPVGLAVFQPLRIIMTPTTMLFGNHLRLWKGYVKALYGSD
jgi:hypothetical protein